MSFPPETASSELRKKKKLRLKGPHSIKDKVLNARYDEAIVSCGNSYSISDISTNS